MPKLAQIQEPVEGHPPAEGHPPLPRSYHHYVGSKAPWHQITDDLEQFAEDVPD